MKHLRKKFWAKFIACTLGLLFLSEILSPTVSFALTGGPSQPEVQSFMPISVSEMVDLSSGDFHYNIPLLQVGDYPVNLIYNSGITADQEASWVGLGWNINPGVINRQMRSIPDDFKGDEITTKTSMKDNQTFGVNVASPNIEISGFSLVNLNFSLGISYNNYTGIGFTQTIGMGLTLAAENSDDDNVLNIVNMTSSLDGPLSIKPDLSLSKKTKKKTKQSVKKQAQSGQTADTDPNEQTEQSQNTEDENASAEAAASGTSTGEKNRGKEARSPSMASYLLNNPGHTPTVDHPMKFTPLSLRLKLGGAAFLIDGQAINLTGYYNKQKVNEETLTTKSYGYNFLEKAGPNDLLDFNRENDVPYKRTIPYISNPAIGYDSYIVNGQGIGGMFRPYRSDFGALYTPKVKSGTIGGSVGVEAEAGFLFDLGFDVQVNTGSSTTKKWTESNQLSDIAKFRSSPSGSASSSDGLLYEPYYFKFLGDMPFDTEIEEIKEEFLGEKPVQIEVDQFGTAKKTLKAKNWNATGGADLNFSTSYSTSYDYPTRTKRVKRNTMISQLTAAEVEEAGLIGWRNNHSKDHHIGEISVTQENGVRYIYGRPAYNVSQTEMQFNVSGQAIDLLNGTVSYDPNTATTDNENGNNHYFHSKSIPPYAHSYLISAVLSDDYADSDNTRGPSPSDIGSYTLFNYYSPYLYKWRTPYGTNEASYNEGIKSKDDDDQGVVVEGRKQIHYLHEIRSKDQIAVFTLVDDRDDSRESDGDFKMKRLKQIDLYSLINYEENYPNAVPVKTVHFDYNYELCNGAENSSSGKLTLRKVYFTYGSSDLSALNQYQFDYANNEDYHKLAYDVWGNYKPVSGNNNPGGLRNNEYPYLDQDFDTKNPDTWTSAWSLNSIKLPSGGIINIDYEADRYAYVQNKRAMQMIKVLAVRDNSSGSGTTDNTLYPINDKNNPSLYMDLAVPPGQFDSDQDFINDCVLPLRSQNAPIYFNFSTDVLNNNSRDRITGYFLLDQSTAPAAGTDDNVVTIKVRPVQMEGVGNNIANPVSFAAWNHAKLHHPKKAYGFPEINTGGPINTMLSLAGGSLINGIVSTIVGPDVRIRNAGMGRVIDPQKSWIRLNAPKEGKYGGGHRVKQITLTDNWNEMSSPVGGSSPNYQASYGQYYDYTLDDGINSSGVATFEPARSKENPLVTPAYYKEERVLVPSEEYYLEGPVGASFYPSAQVTYSRISVKSLYLEEDRSEDPGSGNFVDVTNDVSNHHNGYSVTEFYTSKDFPTKSSATEKDVSNSLLGSLIGNLFSFYTFNWESISQGFYVETNDMNGQLKKQAEYNADGVLMTSTEYTYQMEYGENVGLDNKILVVDKDLTVSCKEVGTEFELYHDFKENRSVNEIIGLQPNVGTFFIFIFPVVVPAFYPDINVHETRLRTASTMKVIHKHGILKETKVYNQGAEITTENLAYDKESGEVLLSSYTNEYGEKHYSFAYPAHWKYPRMGAAYENEGLVLRQFGTNSIGALGGPGTNLLYSGDEVYISTGGIVQKGWVYQPDGLGKYLIDESGEPIIDLSATSSWLSTDYMKVIRSGNRNMQGMSMGNLVTFHNPLGDGITPESICNGTGSSQLQLIPPSGKGILMAGSNSYNDEWRAFASESKIVLPIECSDFPGSNWLEGVFPLINQILPFVPNEDGTYSFDGNSFWGDIEGFLDLYAGSNEFIECNSNYDIIVQVYTNPEFFGRILYFGIDMPNCPGLLDLGTGGGLLFSLDFSPNDCNWGGSYLTGALYEVQPITGGGYQNVTNPYFYFLEGRFAYLNTSLEFCTGGIKGLEKLTFPVFETQMECPTQGIGDAVNPFTTGLKGTWRLDKEWAYTGDRSYNYGSDNGGTASETSNLREDGYISSFTPFWNYSSNQWNESTSTDWVTSREVTEYNPFSAEVENIDPLHRFSSAVFGFDQKLPICLANNATYSRIGFDSFEDYDYYECESGCFDRHFAFDEESEKVTQDEAHTGYHSIGITGEGSIEMERDLRLVPQADATFNAPPPYLMSSANDLGEFGPEVYDPSAYAAGEANIIYDNPSKYILSYWVKENELGNSFEPVNSYVGDASNHSYEIAIDDVQVNYGAVKTSPIIDGWQRVEVEFFIPTSIPNPGGLPLDAIGKMVIRFKGTSGSKIHLTTYLDDLRIHPFNSSFKSFTYDYRTLRLMAELDENNFATIYQYDPEGNLVRVKKETERGVMTLQEYRKDLPNIDF